MRRTALYAPAVHCPCGAEHPEQVLGWELIRYRNDPPTRRVRRVRCGECGDWFWITAGAYQAAREVLDPAAA